MLTKPSLTLRRHLKAPPEKVYRAWTDVSQLARWFGPAECVPGTFEGEVDARVGGRYRAAFDTDDGEHHEVGGVYREVVPNERLKFTWAWHSTPERELLVTITIRPDGEGTMLTLTHEQFFDEAARDGHRHGWSGCLDKLEAYFS